MCLLLMCCFQDDLLLRHYDRCDVFVVTCVYCPCVVFRMTSYCVTMTKAPVRTNLDIPEHLSSGTALR